MKKTKILCILLAFVLILTFAAACRTNDEPPSPTPEPASTTDPEPTPAETAPPEQQAEPDAVTLKWAVWDIETVSYYTPLIDAYKEIAPHITIELVDLGSDNWNEVIQTHLIGLHDYDLIKVRNIAGYELHVNADLLLPLGNMASAREITIGDFMGIPEQFTIHGNFYALPFKSDFWVVYYNMDLFDEAEVAYPNNQMTFDDWVSIIKLVTHGSGEEKVWGNFFHNWRSATTLFGILDGEHTINDGSYDFLAPYYEAVLELEDGGFVPRRTDMLAGGIGYRDVWEPGYTAQINMGTWFIADALQADFNWGIAAYPVPAPANYGNTFGQVTQLAIPRIANHPEEAMDFITFATGSQGAQVIAATGQIPAMMTDAVLDIFSAIPGFPQDETTRGALRPRNIILEQLPQEQAGETNTILNEIHSEIMDRAITIEDGIAMMNERVGAILH